MGMQPPTSPHPSQGQLSAFDKGLLRPAEWEEIERHLASCDTCCRQLDTVPEDPFVARLRLAAGQQGVATPAGETATVDAPAVPTAPPASLATASAVPDELADHPRYRILQVLGAG